VFYDHVLDLFFHAFQRDFQLSVLELKLLDQLLMLYAHLLGSLDLSIFLLLEQFQLLPLDFNLLDAQRFVFVLISLLAFSRPQTFIYPLVLLLLFD